MSASSNSTRIVKGSGTRDDPYQWPHNVVPQAGEYVVSRTSGGSHVDQINEPSTEWLALILDGNPQREYIEEFINYDSVHIGRYTETTHPFLDPRESMFGIKDRSDSLAWFRAHSSIESVEVDRSGTPYCFLPLYVSGTIYATTE